MNRDFFIALVLFGLCWVIYQFLGFWPTVVIMGLAVFKALESFVKGKK